LTAEELVKEYGKSLIGRKVMTQKVGFWPGGLARVISLNPDPNAPEIIMMVRGLENQSISCPGLTDNQIGILKFEEISMVKELTLNPFGI
jgi:hypothetical protein